MTFTSGTMRMSGGMTVFFSIVGAIVIALPYHDKDVTPLWAAYGLFAVGVSCGVILLVKAKALQQALIAKQQSAIYVSLIILLWTASVHLATGGLKSPFTALYFFAVATVAQLLSPRATVGLSGVAGLAFLAVAGVKGQLRWENLPLILAWSSILLLVVGFSSSLMIRLRQQVSHQNEAREEMAHVVSSVQSTSDHVAASAEQLWASTEEMRQAAEQVAGSAHQIAQGADLQAEHMAATSRFIGSVDASTKTIAANAEATGAALQQASGEVARASDLLDVLGRHTQQIDRMVALIERIDDQTELLALNAAIEAARAGEHGRGFAVVAQEVRKLSDSSNRAVGEIAELSRQIQRSTDNLLDSMEAIVADIRHSTQLAEETIEATRKQEVGAQNMVEAINEMASIVEQNAASTVKVSEAVEGQAAAFEQVAASAHNLAEMSSRLQQLVDQLRILPRSHAHRTPEPVGYPPTGQA